MSSSRGWLTGSDQGDGEIRRLSIAIVLGLAITACGGNPQGTTTTQDLTTTEPNAATTTEPAPITTEADGGDGAAITISGFSFGAPISVSVGDTVTVTNDDPFAHTWTSEDDVWDSGSIGSGDTFQFTFDKAGTFPFFCKIHPDQMMGSITVEG